MPLIELVPPQCLAARQVKLPVAEPRLRRGLEFPVHTAGLM